jgi:cell fate regulator YaaT (PSP1 superfamily)
MAKYVVRHGAMRTMGVFAPRGNEPFVRGDRVVVRTSRGLESGEVLCEATPQAVEQLNDPDNGQLLRIMTAEDENELSRMRANQGQLYDVADRCIGSSGLDMRLVDVEQIFGGERVIVYYLSENRVDFRDLVKQLAGEFQTRIEMRQIGVRDEAKLLADYGDCGKPVCCNTHLSEMPPVSMKMAKLQKATLDPNKISGRCGRLKCCLRYEYDTYEALAQDLPPIGSDVLTANGRGRILAHEILASQLLISTEDSRRILINASDVLTVLNKGQGSGARGQDEDAVSGN